MEEAELNWMGLLLFGVLTNKYHCSNSYDEVWPRINDLVSRGANVNARNHVRYTPAMECCRGKFGPFEILLFFIKNGADLEATCIFSNTALHLACQSNNIGCVVVLLGSGVALDKINRAGATALWDACYMGHFEIVKRLVQRGADTNIKLCSKVPKYQRFNGYSPREAAIWAGNYKIAEYMNPRELNWRRRYFYARLLQSVKGAPTINMAIRMLQCDDVARVIGSYL